MDAFQRISGMSLLALAGVLAGCAAPQPAQHDHGQQGATDTRANGHKSDGRMSGMEKHDMHMGKMAVAKVTPTQGNSAAGEVMFHAMGDHVMVHARLTGLKPNGEHGFHVHDKGDCSSADGSSAGGHFNPSGKAHGAQDGEHHVGDMPNLKADASGVVNQHLMLHGVTLEGAAGIMGRGLIVHANADDYSSQPAGNSGPRIACGVIAAR